MNEPSITSAGDHFEELIRRKANEVPSQHTGERFDLESAVQHNLQAFQEAIVQGRGDIGMGVGLGGRMIDQEVPGQLITAVKITYDARTGKVVFPKGITGEDDFRIFKTWILSKPIDPDQPDKEYFRILDVMPEGWLKGSDFIVAMEGAEMNEDGEIIQKFPTSSREYNRWIEPQKVLLGHDWFRMESLYVERTDFTEGDRAFFESVTRFNNQHWESLASEVFQAAAVKGIADLQETADRLEQADPQEQPSIAQTPSEAPETKVPSKQSLWKKIRGLFGRSSS